jgi:hypothetical protein
LRTAYGSASSYSNKSQIIETSNVVQFWGKSATLSLKVRRNASFTSNLNVTIQKSATVDASQIATWSDIGQVVVSNASMPTGTTSVDWYSTELTFSVPSDGTANSLRIVVGEASAGVSGAFWELAQVQLEVSSVATPFKRNASNIQGELAACQRYYYRDTAVVPYSRFGNGSAASTTSAQIDIRLPVTMRSLFSSLEYSGLLLDDGAGTVAVTSLASVVNGSGLNYVSVAAGVSSGLTQYRFYHLEANNSTSAYIAFSAEL